MVTTELVPRSPTTARPGKTALALTDRASNWLDNPHGDAQSLLVDFARQPASAHFSTAVIRYSHAFLIHNRHELPSVEDLVTAYSRLQLVASDPTIPSISKAFPPSFFADLLEIDEREPTDSPFYEAIAVHYEGDENKKYTIFVTCEAATEDNFSLKAWKNALEPLNISIKVRDESPRPCIYGEVTPLRQRHPLENADDVRAEGDHQAFRFLDKNSNPITLWRTFDDDTKISEIPALKRGTSYLAKWRRDGGFCFAVITKDKLGREHFCQAHVDSRGVIVELDEIESDSSPEKTFRDSHSLIIDLLPDLGPHGAVIAVDAGSDHAYLNLPKSSDYIDLEYPIFDTRVKNQSILALSVSPDQRHVACFHAADPRPLIRVWHLDSNDPYMVWESTLSQLPRPLKNQSPVSWSNPPLLSWSDQNKLSVTYPIGRSRSPQEVTLNLNGRIEIGRHTYPLLMIEEIPHVEITGDQFGVVKHKTIIAGKEVVYVVKWADKTVSSGIDPQVIRDSRATKVVK